MSDSEDVDAGDIIRIMVATDNHLGYAEKDVVRGEDSFTAFEEILEMAVEEDVDFILLGGDLFHDATPSQNSLNRCLKLLRSHTLGDKPIAVEFLSDQAQNFHDALNSTVNYEDPNINVSLPVFSIHGNHDDPSGFGRLSSLDLLSNTGLINYFGRWTDLTKVEISPILLRKGATQLALFGLSHIHDARLARLFEYNKVVVERPDPTTGEWFNLMVLHQNRADRGPKNYIAEERLPDFLHLVIWGHEHDCHPTADYNSNRDFYVYQPGSSVPTSLAEGEALPKHVGILEVYTTKFQIKPLRLQTVRPFVFQSVTLSDLIEELKLDEGDVSNKVMGMAKERVEEMIDRAKEQLTGHPKQPTLPLIRLRLVYSDEEQMFNAIRFGQQYNERVANPSDIVIFKKLVKKSKNEANAFDKDAMHNAFDKMDIETSTRVEDLVDRYFEEVEDNKKLKLFSSKILSESIARMVEHGDNDAADRIFKFYKDKAIEHLMEKLPNDDDISEELLNFKTSNVVSHDMVLKMLDSRGAKNSNTSLSARASKTSAKEQNNSDILLDEAEVISDDGEAAASTTSSRGRGKKVTTTTRGRGRGRGRGAARGGNSTAANASTSGTKTSHAMPKLDVSIGSTRSSGRQQTLLDSIGQRQSTRRVKAKVYEISDDSD